MGLNNPLLLDQLCYPLMYWKRHGNISMATRTISIEITAITDAASDGSRCPFFTADLAIYQP